MIVTIVRPAAVLLAVAVAVALGPHGQAPPASQTLSIARPGARADATSAAEARQMRRATRQLAGELTEAARCDVRQTSRRFAACVTPAMRHAGIGGRTTAMLVRGVMARVHAGRCRSYLFGLQAANDAAGDSARWLLPQLYEPGLARRRREIAGQLALAGAMLRRASRRADACSLAAAMPTL
jgi:hypothetical protein